MGTKGGKPLSAIERRQMKLAKKEEKKVVKEEKKEYRLGIVDPSLLKKVAEDIKNFDFVTTFTLAQRHNIRYSLAKKILKELAAQNIVNIVLKTRRVIIAVPVKSSSQKSS
jgi:ribosomal protein S25